MDKVKEMFCNLDYHWCKRFFKHKSAEVEAYSGLIGLSNKISILLGRREIYFDLSIFYALLHRMSNGIAQEVSAKTMQKDAIIEKIVQK